MFQKRGKNVDEEKVQEAELLRLQKLYRFQEGRRLAFNIKMKNVLQKQGDLIGGLNGEKEDLLFRLRTTKSPQSIKKEKSLNNQIADLLRIRSEYDAKIKQEKDEVREVGTEILKLEKEVTALRSHDRSDYVWKKLTAKFAKKLDTLENSLYSATVKLNKLEAGNVAIRNEVEHLFKERERFSILYQQLISRITDGKKIMMELVEKASLTCDHRDDIQRALRSMKDRHRNDTLVQSKDMRELHRRRDRDVILRDLMGTKGQKRIMVDIEQLKIMKKEHRKQEMRDLITKYKDIINQIQQYTGETDIDKLASQFLKQEEDNFAHFNYVNDLNTEMSSLLEELTELRDKIDHQRNLHEARTMQQNDRVEKLREERILKKEEMHLATEKLNERTQVLNTLLKGITQIFEMIRCEKSPLLKLLGNHKRIHRHNVMMYLAIIEQQTNDLVTQLYYTEKTDVWEQIPCQYPLISDKVPVKLKAIPIDKMAPTQPCALCVEKEETAKLVESLVMPFTQEETMKQVQERLTQEDAKDLFHNLSACRLFRARRLGPTTS